MGVKARRYLRAGTRLVWIVWPRRWQVDVWCPGDQTPSQTLGLADSLDGLDVVPGFTYPLAKLFACRPRMSVSYFRWCVGERRTVTVRSRSTRRRQERRTLCARSSRGMKAFST
jgi:hypothetical protein